ncbi:hypothetical protein D9M71_748610 [compost metagenome]
MGHLFLDGHVAEVSARIATGGLAGGHGFIQFFLVQVHEGEFRALGGQVLTHGTAEALATTGNDDDLVFELHEIPLE